MAGRSAEARRGAGGHTSIAPDLDAGGSPERGLVARWPFGAALPAGSMPAAAGWDGALLIPGAVTVAGRPAIGISASLGAIALVALVTIGVFFGVAFGLLRQPGHPALLPSATGRHGADVIATQQSGLPEHVGSGAASGRTVPKAADHSPPAVSVAAGASSRGRNASPTPPAAAPDVSSQNPKAAAMTQPPAHELAALVARGDAFLRTRDIASARLFYERAAADGDGQAAFRVGATFDPIFLASLGLRAMRGDRARAVSWYRRAIALGASNAGPYLRRLETR
ncbi:MAG: hypothetical protein ACREE2_14960 [Stellaceae bacterium]